MNGTRQDRFDPITIIELSLGIIFFLAGLPDFWTPWTLLGITLTVFAVYRFDMGKKGKALGYITIGIAVFWFHVIPYFQPAFPELKGAQEPHRKLFVFKMIERLHIPAQDALVKKQEWCNNREQDAVGQLVRQYDNLDKEIRQAIQKNIDASRELNFTRDENLTKRIIGIIESRKKCRAEILENTPGFEQLLKWAMEYQLGVGVGLLGVAVMPLLWWAFAYSLKTGTLVAPQALLKITGGAVGLMTVGWFFLGSGQQAAMTWLGEGNNMSMLVLGVITVIVFFVAFGRWKSLLVSFIVILFVLLGIYGMHSLLAKPESSAQAASKILEALKTFWNNIKF